MNIAQFIAQYPNEDHCREKFRQYRKLHGVECRNCGCSVHYDLKGKNQGFRCKNCGTFTSLKSGTLLHHSKLTYRDWFLAIFLLTQTKNPYSALEVCRQLGRSSYKAVWYLCHKIRNVMGEMEKENVLSGQIELDESFFTIYKERTGERFSHDHLATVLVMAESQEDDSSRYGYRMGRIRMVNMETGSGREILHNCIRMVSGDSVLRSDGSSAHHAINSFFPEVRQQVLNSTWEVMHSLPWVHISTGNCRDRIIGTHRMYSRRWLQRYLDEYTWKVNNRKHIKDWFVTVVSYGCKFTNSLIVA